MDADICAFTISARCETKFDWGDGCQTRQANLDEAKAEVRRWVSEITDRLNANHVVMALSDKSRRYFRHDLFPAYKAHRTHGETPLLLLALKDFLREEESFHPYERPDLEADDILGILATHPKLVPGEKIIVTADKDLLTIPGLHWNPRKPEQGVIEQSEGNANTFFYQQALSGDPTDGVPGCPRIGPVKAQRIVAEALLKYDADPEAFASRELAVWESVVDTYASKGKDADFALQQSRCVRVLRHTDYDFINKRPILWEPK